MISNETKTWLENVRDTCAAALEDRQIEVTTLNENSEKSWRPWPVQSGFSTYCKYRVARPRMEVNGVMVKMPETEEPETGTTYFMPAPISDEWVIETKWNSSSVDKKRLRRGLVHLCRENAVAHAQAMVENPDDTRGE